METMTCGEALEWGHTSESAMKKFFGALKIVPILLGGRAPIHDLSLIDVSRRGVYLTFRQGTAFADNEVFRVVRPFLRREDPVLVTGQPRLIVAEVKFVRAIEKTRDLVHVVRGSVIKGTGAEKFGCDFRDLPR